MAEISYQKGFFENSRNVKLFHQQWISQASKATVCIIHGVGEHSGRYEEVAQYLVENNVSVFTFDLQGYGQSEGKRGHIDSFSWFIEDVESFYTFIQPSIPTPKKIFLLGHSLGALIATHFGIHNTNMPFKGIILSGPPFKIISIPAWWNRVGILLASVLPALTFQETSIQLNTLTHDKNKIESFRTDPYRHYYRSFQFIKEYFRAEKKAFKSADKVYYPLLIVQGGDDDIVDVHKVREYYDRLTIEDKTLIVYPEMFHEVLNEVNRRRVFTDILSWIEHHS